MLILTQRVKLRTAWQTLMKSAFSRSQKTKIRQQIIRVAPSSRGVTIYRFRNDLNSCAGVSFRESMLHDVPGRRLARLPKHLGAGLEV
jgi:hypothetical protein